MEVAGKSSENVFTIKRVRAIIKNETNRQSRNMCVKCHTDGELPVDEKSILAVHILHPAAAHRQRAKYLLCVAKGLLKRRYIFMEKSKKLRDMFRESLSELRDSHTMAVIAMLLALAVVLAIFGTVQVTDFLKIGFSFLPNEIAAMLFGPSVGGIVAGVADILKYLVKPVGAFFPGFTVSAVAGGILYGLILYKKPLTVWRIVAAKVVVAILVNTCLNTYWLTVMYGNSFVALLPARLLKQLVMVPVEAVLFYLVAKTLARAKVFALMKSQ